MSKAITQVQYFVDLEAKGSERSDTRWLVLVAEISPNPADNLNSILVNELLQHVLLKICDVFVLDGKPPELLRMYCRTFHS